MLRLDFATYSKSSARVSVFLECMTEWLRQACISLLYLEAIDMAEVLAEVQKLSEEVITDDDDDEEEEGTASSRDDADDVTQ